MLRACRSGVLASSVAVVACLVGAIAWQARAGYPPGAEDMARRVGARRWRVHVKWSRDHREQPALDNGSITRTASWQATLDAVAFAMAFGDTLSITASPDASYSFSSTGSYTFHETAHTPFDLLQGLWTDSTQSCSGQAIAQKGRVELQVKGGGKFRFYAGTGFDRHCDSQTKGWDSSTSPPSARDYGGTSTQPPSGMPMCSLDERSATLTRAGEGYRITSRRHDDPHDGHDVTDELCEITIAPAEGNDLVAYLVAEPSDEYYGDPVTDALHSSSSSHSSTERSALDRSRLFARSGSPVDGGVGDGGLGGGGGPSAPGDIPHEVLTAKYDDWAPEGPDPDAKRDHGSSIFVRVYLAHDGQPDSPVTRPFQTHLHLDEVSHLPGVSTSDATDDGLPDLRITRPGKGSPYLSARDDTSATTLPAAGALQFQITSFDYGGYAKVCAEVTLDDGTQLVARPRPDQGSGPCLELPRSDDGDHVADVLER